MSTVVVERFHCRYRVPRGHPAPGAVRTRLDGVVRERLPDACRSLLAGSAPDAEGGVLLIRHLDLKLRLGGSLPDDATIAALWSRALATGVSHALAAGPSGERAVRFATWGAYLARFAVDVARGVAWSRWYYTPFAALRGRGPGAAIRAALVGRPVAIAPALAELHRAGRLGWVAATLSDADAWAVFDVLPLQGTVSAGTPWDAVAASWQAEHRSGGPGAVALGMVGTLAASGYDITDSVAGAIRHLAVVTPLLREHQSRVAAGDWGGVVRPAARREPAVAAALAYLAGQPDLRAAISGPPDPRPDGVPVADDGDLVTPFGGVFLLLTALAELDLAALLAEAGVEVEEPERTAALGRWLILLKCLGPSSRAAARHDPALRLAAGLASSPTREDLHLLGRLMRPVSLTRLSAAIAAWAVRRSLSDGRPHATEAVRISRRRQASVIRHSAGMWLGVGLSSRMPDSTGEAASNVPVVPPAADDLAHLRTPDLLPGKRADLAWSLLAALTLQLVARRLTGFGRSSAGYLARNFLEGSAVLSITDEGVQVGLPHVPLRLVLRMAGWPGSVHAVPWLPGQRLRFDAGEE